MILNTYWNYVNYEPKMLLVDMMSSYLYEAKFSCNKKKALHVNKCKTGNEGGGVFQHLRTCAVPNSCMHLITKKFKNKVTYYFFFKFMCIIYMY